LGAAQDYTTLTKDSLDEDVAIELPSAAFLTAPNPAAFTVSRIWETVDVPNSDNIITVMLASNVYIRKGTDVTISGLTGSQTPSTNTLEVC
jgi:hypothetical protein